MPFIWDDHYYYYLKDMEEEYDKSRFVIVRKLFVTPRKSSNEVSN